MLEYPGELPKGWWVEKVNDEWRLRATSLKINVAIVHANGNVQVKDNWVFGTGANFISWVQLRDVIDWCQVQLQEHRRLGEVDYTAGKYTQACSCGGKWEQWYQLNCYHYTADDKQIDVEEAA